MGDDENGGADRGAAYTSGWFTVVLPTLGFLILWPGISVLVLALLRFRAPGWVAVVVVILALPASLALLVKAYPLLLRLAAGGRGELRIEGERIRWRTGRRWRRIDLARGYDARIAAGSSAQGEPNASVSFREAGLLVHLRGGRHEEVLEAFPEPAFVDELAVTPEEGLWGFVLDGRAPADRALFTELLEALWRTRGRNALYRTFSRFPWSTPPRPAFSHIEVLEPGEGGERRELLARLETEVVSRPTPWLAATPDYLLGSEAYPLREELGRGSRSFLMPLGLVRAEEALPRPDLAPSLLGDFVITALGGGPGDLVPLRDRRFLRISGRGRDGRPLTVAFEWLGPADEGYDEARFFVRFVNRAG
jgi:hypothetical protein